jgi:cation:H+ antiporter
LFDISASPYRGAAMTSTWRKVAMAAGVAMPAVAFRVAGVHLASELAAIVNGAAVVGAAFLLAWAAEAAQVDISGSLAIALLALVAVLPEYAVDLYFSYTAGHDPSYAQYAAANMTGSNRLLMGIGWPVVVFAGIAAYQRRRKATDAAAPDQPAIAPVRAGVSLPAGTRVEIGFLAIASVYAFIIPFTKRLAWYDSVVLLALFAAYLWRVTRSEPEVPDLIGVAADVGALPKPRRRTVVALLFVAAAAIVLAAAEPFANGLVDTGAKLGIDRFLLVQWLAPLASEAPELIIAVLFAWRLRADDGLTTLLSSKVNQWTMLVGSLPIAYAIGGGHGGLALDPRQQEEFLLTAAQALLGVAMLVDLDLKGWEAGALLGLFVLQFPFPTTHVRIGFAAAYIVMALVLLITRRSQLPAALAATFRHRDPGSAEHQRPG